MGLALDKGDQPGLNPSIPPCISGHSQQVHRSQDTKYYVIHSIETQKNLQTISFGCHQFLLCLFIFPKISRLTGTIE